SNPDNMNVSIGKAGRKRWMGRMPHNRGVSMNPIDHPHGGGEGRTSGGRHPVTPWGFPTKGKKTRRNKSPNKFILLSPHPRGKNRRGPQQWRVGFGKVRLSTAICSRRRKHRARLAATR